MRGRIQSVLVNKYQDAGNYTVIMQRGMPLAAGIYLIAFKAGNFYQEMVASLTR
jgi:5-hydroxyisourate hydrolase-like protein (transthyretin family)